MAGAERPTICQLVHTLDVGGAEILAREFAQHAEDEFRFVFACLDHSGSMGRELVESGYAVTELHRRDGIDFGCAMRLRRFLREQRVRLVHAHQHAPFFYAMLSRLGGWSPPVLFTEHGRDYPDFRRPKRIWATRVLMRRCDRVTAVGEGVKRALIDYEGIAAERIRTVYNGVNLTRFEHPGNELQRQVTRHELGLKEDEVALILVARLNRLKDMPTAVKAVAQLVQRCPRVRFLIVGEGEERALIERTIRECHVENSVRLLGLRKDIPQLLGAADVFFMTSLSEGISLALIEAMGAGLPVVATAVGGNPEVVADGETGWLVPAEQPAAMAERLEFLVRDEALRHQMGAAARTRAHQLFSASTMHATYGQTYREMLGRG